MNKDAKAVAAFLDRQELKDLTKTYNTLTADERNSADGKAIIKQIYRLTAATKGVGINIADDGSINAVDLAALAEQRTIRQEATRAIKAALQPMPMELLRNGANRNKPCPCGSGLKFKKCCWLKNEPIHILP